MKKLITAAILTVGLTTTTLAVSVGELISRCGDDSEKYCQGVGYGDPMQACLDANYAKLADGCKIIVDRIREGEKVSLF